MTNAHSGRPPKAPAEAYSYRITTQVARDTLWTLRELAAKRRIPLASLCRHALEDYAKDQGGGHPPAPKDDGGTQDA